MSFAGAVLAPLGTTKLGGAQVFGAAAQVGTVSHGAFEITTPKERPYLGQVTSAPRVDIAAAYPGADGTAIDGFTAAGARGVVIEAMGSGNAGASLIAAVARACRRGVAVAITSRVPGGHARPTYGPGADLVAAGAVMVPRLRAGQARVLLMAALGAGLPVESTVARWG
jgi:L-asparaginase